MPAPKQHPHSVIIGGALRDFPHLSARYNGKRDRLFIYYRHQDLPFLTAIKTAGDRWKTPHGTFNQIGALLKRADEIRKASDNG